MNKSIKSNRFHFKKRPDLLTTTRQIEIQNNVFAYIYIYIYMSFFFIYKHNVYKHIQAQVY